MPSYVTMLNHCHWSEQLLHIDCIIGTQCHAWRDMAVALLCIVFDRILCKPTCWNQRFG